MLGTPRWGWHLAKGARAAPCPRFVDYDFVLALAVFVGVAIAWSLSGRMCHNIAPHRGETLRSVARRLNFAIRGAPKARVLLCDSLRDSDAGPCIVRPEGIGARALHAPPLGSRKPITGLGLLQLPCGHKIHAECAEHWLETKGLCPTCRRDIRSLAMCARMLPRGLAVAAPGSDPAEDAWLEHDESDEFSDPVAQEKDADCKGIGGVVHSL